MDRTVLTAPEMQAILAGLRSLDSVSGSRRYAQLMEKLFAGAGGLVPGGAHMLIDLSSWYKTSLPPKIELIQGAIEQHRTIRCAYFYPKGESVRTVEPFYLVFHWSTWYVWGWCRMREDFRMFKLNRMTDLTAGEPFEPRSAPLPDLELERIFPAKYQVTVSLTRPAAGGWWRSTGQIVSPRNRTAGCALPAAFPTPTACSAGCSPSGTRRSYWNLRNCGSGWGN